MNRMICSYPTAARARVRFAGALILFAVAVPASAAIATSGNVLPAYPGSNPDPWDVGSTVSIGDFGDGVLSVADGSDVTSSGGTAGFAPALTGTITVTGAGSTWTNSADLLLGVFGTGKLNVLAGAHVENQDASVGHINGEGQVLVSGAGSQWTSELDLVIGASGTGSLTIQQQGLVRSDATLIALNDNSIGTIVVDGQQSTLEAATELSVGDGINGGMASLSLTGAGSRVYVGAAAIAQGATLPIDHTAVIVSKIGAPAELSIYEGNSVQNAGSAYVGVGNGESGAVVVDGAATTWTNNGGVFIGVNGVGTLKLAGGATVSSGGPVAVGTGGIVSGVGTIVGTLSNSGLVLPGESIGELSVTGSFSQAASGKFQVELAGSSAGAFDTLAVTNQATLGGVLDVEFNGPFVPQLGDSFEILTAGGGVTGTFSSAELPTLVSGRMWRIQYAANSATLVVKLAGDYNDNGVVDAADFTVWRNLLGSTLDPRADGDTNGIVNFADYNIWKANFGAIAGSGAGAILTSQVVPEPGVWFAIAVTGVAAALRRRTR